MEDKKDVMRCGCVVLDSSSAAVILGKIKALRQPKLGAVGRYDEK